MPEKKNKGGRPRKEIDYPKLEALCKIQCTGEECASVLQIDYDTLNNALKRDGYGGFSEYLKRHSSSGKASLRRLQWKAAEALNTAMLIWLGKQYLGQTDKKDAFDQELPTPVKVTIQVEDGRLDI